MEDIYFKQTKLFNPTESNLKVKIYGGGSIGSHTCIGLAKIGIKDITVYDYDEVETDNFPAQFFDIQSKGKKLDNLKRLTLQMTGTEIKTVDGKIEKEFEPNKEFNSIHILAFDNIEARKVISKALNGFPAHLIDGRIGAFNYEKYYVYCSDDMTEYGKTLEGTFSETECGLKCLWSLNALISAKIVADVIKISKEQVPSFAVKGNLMSEIIINKVTE